MFSEEHRTWWDDFLKDKNGLFSTKEKPSSWILNEVVAMKQRQIANQASQCEPHDALEPERVQDLGLPQRPFGAPKDIEEMVIDQISEIPQV